MDKKKLTEEDIKLRYITPAILAKWEIEHIFMEKQLTLPMAKARGFLVR